MRIELADCERTLLAEIEGGATQKSVALTYAMTMCSSEMALNEGFAARVNAAIVKRWSPAGLQRVKTMAWKLIEERGGNFRAQPTDLHGNVRRAGTGTLNSRCRGQEEPSHDPAADRN